MGTHIRMFDRIVGLGFFKIDFFEMFWRILEMNFKGFVETF